MTRVPTVGPDIPVRRFRGGGAPFAGALLLVLLSVAQPICAERLAPGRSITAHAGFVIDGDSIMVKKDEQDIEVRLFGIDAPEFDQPGSKGARRHLQSLVAGKSLQLNVIDHDVYGRTVALVSAGGAVSVNEEQVRAGQAWVHPRYCRIRICDRWRDEQQQACSRKIGLWRQQRPVPPWRWKACRGAHR